MYRAKSLMFYSWIFVCEFVCWLLLTVYCELALCDHCVCRYPRQRKSRGTVFSFVCCVCFFPHDISKIDAAKLTKLDTEMFLDEFWKPIYSGIKKTKVKVTSHISIAGVGLCTLVGAGFFLLVCSRRAAAESAVSSDSCLVWPGTFLCCTLTAFRRLEGRIAKQRDLLAYRARFSTGFNYQLKRPTAIVIIFVTTL